jgi:hypothetical protein
MPKTKAAAAKQAASQSCNDRKPIVQHRETVINYRKLRELCRPSASGQDGSRSCANRWSFPYCLDRRAMKGTRRLAQIAAVRNRRDFDAAAASNSPTAAAADRG